jgi:uncharacterized membrane protein YgaE (UPF0421/DUF939 family)
MRTRILLIAFIVIFSFDFLNAAAYKGQRVYSKNCASCHGTVEYVTSKTKGQWISFLIKNGDKLAQIHLKSNKAKKSWKYFKSKKYKKKLKHLKDFLLEYAKDSGKVPVF